jgi:hypothetical protein
MTAARAVVLGILLAAVTTAHAQMYKCVDERGVTHYSDSPRPGCKGGKVHIHAIPPASGQEASPPADASRQDAEFRRRQMEREQAETAEKAALQERCAHLRREHAVLASGIRVGKISDTGERIYLDDATRDARLVQLKEELRGCP